MQPTTFLYFAFGDNLNNHTMGNFSILTMKRQSPPNSRFVIYTDRPDYYKWASFVEVRPLNEKRITEWKGPHNFVWRVKIMAMLDSAKTDPGHLIYLDSDTAAYQNLTPMISDLENGSCFMHLKENLLSEDKDKNKNLMWEQTKNKKFGGLFVNEKSAIWNAGVVALSAKDKISLLNTALASTDEMCEQKVTQWLIEQFSLSQSLASTQKLKAADEFIAHYWGNKEEWIQNINLFFSRAHLQNLSTEEFIDSINPELLKTLPIIRYKKSWAKKLLRFSNKYFQDSLQFLKT